MGNLNFNIFEILWFFNWDCDPKYDGWGSPTCPVEPHSHLQNRLHWVDYGTR